MKMLRRLFAWLQPLTLEDPIFGTLLYQRGAGFWEGWASFAPERRAIEVLIDGTEAGPTSAQHTFFRDLERRYDTLIGPIGDLLHETYANWREEVDRGEIWHLFYLTAINIPEGAGAEVAWELSYDCHADEHSFDVQMHGWTPVGVAING